LNYPSDYLSKIGKNANADLSAEDGRLFIPPIIVPAFDMPRPAGAVTTSDVSAADGVVINDSCVHTVYSFHQNQIAQDDTAFFLLAGIWRIQFQLIFHVNFVVTLGNTIGNLDVMDQAGTRINLISHYSLGAASTAYHEKFDFLFHVKPRPDLSVVQGDVWTFFFGVPATNGAAGNIWQCQLGINFQRYL
jgi:hypothetical protein